MKGYKSLEEHPFFGITKVSHPKQKDDLQSNHFHHTNDISPRDYIKAYYESFKDVFLEKNSIQT